MSDNLVESYTKLNKKHQETLKENIILKEALKNLSKGYSKLYCLHYCSFESKNNNHCTQCENGDFNFVMDNSIEQAKENIK